MGFFDELEKACAAQNAHLDEMLEEQQAQAAANQAKEQAEEKLKRRNWAVGVLEAGNMPLQQVDRIAAAMMIAASDTEVACSKVERLLLKHEHYQPVIYQSVVEKFLERGGDPAGELGVYCIKRALALEPGADLFRGDAAQSLSMSLLVLGRFSGDKRPEIATAIQLLRKMFPFTKSGNLQNIPHGLAQRLYPEHYKDGKCVYRFANRLETGEPRKVADHRRQPRHYRNDDKPEENDPEIAAAMVAAANGKLSGIRLMRAS